MRLRARRIAVPPRRCARPTMSRSRRAPAAAPGRARRRGAPPRVSRSTRLRARPTRRQSLRPRASGRSPPRPAPPLRDPARRARAAGRSRAPRRDASVAALRPPPPPASRHRAAALLRARARAPRGVMRGRAPSARPPSTRTREWRDRQSQEHTFYTNVRSPVKLFLQDRLRAPHEPRQEHPGACDPGGRKAEDVRRHAGAAGSAARLGRGCEIDRPVQDGQRSHTGLLQHALSVDGFRRPRNSQLSLNRLLGSSGLLRSRCSISAISAASSCAGAPGRC